VSSAVQAQYLVALVVGAELRGDGDAGRNDGRDGERLVEGESTGGDGAVLIGLGDQRADVNHTLEQTQDIVVKLHVRERLIYKGNSNTLVALRAVHSQAHFGKQLVQCSESCSARLELAVKTYQE
jgi:hypothetical protein